MYEGLLDHTARRAAEPVLGLTGSKDQEPEIPLSTLEEKQAKGDDTFIEYLAEETGRSAKTLKKALETPDITDPHEVLMACGQDARLVKRVLPMIGTVRRDDFQRLEIIPEGSLYVTRGSDRRSTGTHYTPRILTEPLVKHTLDPLVYIGPAEGKPESEWVLKTAKEILQLKVCDLAMGSGAFLVQADRYLAERLVEAWEIVEKNNPGRYIVTPDGELSTGSPTERLMPRDPAERIAIARRCIADRCLYGVDINPMAVEMAKLSLWLATMAKDHPFTFLDHAIKCGDSLVGLTNRQIAAFHWDLDASRERVLGQERLEQQIAKVAALRRDILTEPEDTEFAILRKQAKLADADAAARQIKTAGDLVIAAFFAGGKPKKRQELRDEFLERYLALQRQQNVAENLKWQVRTLEGLRGGSPDPVRSESQQGSIGEGEADGDVVVESSPLKTDNSKLKPTQPIRPFHWEIEFPEVFSRENPGFDGIVGNPPFMGGRLISGSFSTSYLEALGELYPETGGQSDYVAYFFRRAFHHSWRNQTGW